MDPSGKAIFAAISKRSGANGSIVSAIGGLALVFAIRNSNSRQPHRTAEPIVGFIRDPATSFILTARPELEMNLRDRSVAQIFARKGNAVLSAVKRERRKEIACPARRRLRVNVGSQHDHMGGSSNAPSPPTPD